MKIHGTVLLSGAPEALSAVQEDLGDNYVAQRLRRNALLLYDVEDSVVSSLGDNVEARTAQTYELDPSPKRVAATVDLMQGAWYRTNQDAFPLLRVRRVRHRIDSDEYLFDVDLFNEKNLASPATMTQEVIAGYGLKAASEADFAKLDIAIPAGFSPDPHAIPVSDQTGMESGTEEAQKKEDAPIGVSLAQAHIAAAQARNELGVYCASTRVVEIGDGFGVEATLRARYAQSFPSEILATPVSYVYA